MENSFSDTELCVKCGLCLPHCPTYGKTLDENESPRGRLALIQAWAGGQLEASPRLLSHVNNCLLCRSCESACPANVPYGRLVDDFRAATADKQTKSIASRVRSAAVGLTLQSAKLQRLAGPARRLLSRSGLLRAIGLGEIVAGLPEPCEHGRWQGFHPALGEETAHVAVFLGCTAELADAETVTAAIRLLTRLGVSVTVPEVQGCCGGMALHAGDGKGFNQMSARNLAAFNTDNFDAIIALASGCAAVLKEYPEQTGFSAKIRDVSRFLVEHTWPGEVRLEPLSARVLVHSPCSLKNVLKSERYVPELLNRIPEIRVDMLADVPGCCGAAGAYLLDHPEMARALQGDLLDIVVRHAPDYLLSSNVGCTMHLRAGLKARGLAGIGISHPVVLLERQSVRFA